MDILNEKVKSPSQNLEKIRSGWFAAPRIKKIVN